MKLSKMSLLIAVIILFFLFWIGYQMKPGSYPNAELYEFDCSEEDLITAIADLKLKSGYQLPEFLNFQEGRKSSTGPYYLIFFYYPKENQLINAWVRTLDGKATLAFVGIASDLNLSKWQRINENLDYEENENQKKKFQERIVNKLKLKLERN